MTRRRRTHHEDHLPSYAGEAEIPPNGQRCTSGGQSKSSPIHVRVRHGLAGIKEGWLRERSFRTHSAVSVLVLVALLYGQPGAIWWAVAFLALGAGLGLEMMNGALEALSDHLHPVQHSQIRIVKDMASGGVLVVNMAAVMVGLAMLLDCAAQ